MPDNAKERNFGLETTSAIAKAKAIDERAPEMSPASACAIAIFENAQEL